MAVCVIKQSPLWNVFTAGEDIIFVVSNNTAVANETKVKFNAQVHIGTSQINLSSTADIVGTFKTTPNNAGVGMFNLRNVIENYVKADHTASTNAEYKGATASAELFPVHLIDEFSRNRNSVRYLAIQFQVEFLDADTNSSTYGQIISTGSVNSSDYTFFNGYLKYTDELQLSSNGVNFGYPLDSFFYLGFAGPKRFLTNAPTTQYANFGDYGTLAFLVPSATVDGFIDQAIITFYNEAGVAHGTTFNVGITSGNGAYSSWSTNAERQLLYFGCFPGNLAQNPTNSAVWDAIVTWGLTHYTIVIANTAGSAKSETVTIHLNCPNLKDYESIRLCWLNQWGAWDYYTFTQKSITNITTQGTTYTQLDGTWNDATYQISSYKGGKKAFRKNATEKIKINTDFVSESDNVMFEELINSPEVYLLEGLQTDTYNALNQYVTPVRLTTSSFTKKTIANDKLMQYTFEIEKSKTLRTQSI